MIDVCLLGCGGIMPLRKRALTALLLRCRGSMLLTDCGEGTQVQMRDAGWGFRALGAICFTHYHADHTAGLPGLLLTLANSGRTDPLLLCGPPGLRQVVEGLTVIAPRLPFDLRLIELHGSAEHFAQAGGLSLSCLSVEHGIPCLAYRFDLARSGRFDAGRAKALNVPLHSWKLLQQGRTVETRGGTVTPSMVLGAPRRGLRLCYCTDGRPSEALARFAAQSDLFVCEGLYGEEERMGEAAGKGHMVFSEAASLAKAAGCRKLWLTHYSPALSDPEEFLARAAAVFPAAELGSDLKQTVLRFDDD